MKNEPLTCVWSNYVAFLSSAWKIWLNCVAFLSSAWKIWLNCVAFLSIAWKIWLNYVAFLASACKNVGMTWFICKHESFNLCLCI